MQDPVTILKAS